MEGVVWTDVAGDVVSSGELWCCRCDLNM
jgi:hypothetical protein